MKKTVLTILLATGFASAAHAGEARVEAHAGVYWEPGASTNGPVSYSKAAAGLALGYDQDIGGPFFVGAELSADKVLGTAFNRVSIGVAGRLGAKLSEADRLYAVGGYASKLCRTCRDAGILGGGFQHDFGALYGKVEYRRFVTGQGSVDGNSLVAGLGLHF